MKSDSETDETKLIERALRICRTKHASALMRRAEVNKEIESMERKIKNYERLTSSPFDPTVHNTVSLKRERSTARRRIRHNHSELMFKELLQARDGVGATLKELIALTGTSVATAYRVIRRLEGDKKVQQDNSAHWHWLTK